MKPMKTGDQLRPILSISITLVLLSILLLVPASESKPQFESNYGYGYGVTKVTICHIPPGNPDNAKTMTVGSPAVDAHLAHGDTLGECNG